MTDNLRRTPLYEEHVKAKAKMIPFAGWEMPIQYSSVIKEHQNVRNNLGIFDVSHMGEIEIRGKDAIIFADYIVTNSVRDMRTGKVKYTPMCYPDGGEVDDLFVYKLGEGFILLVVNASNYEKDLEWVIKNKSNFDVEILGKTEDYGEVAIQGPKAEEFLDKYFYGTTTLKDLGFFQSTNGELFGIPVLISRTGYTGEDGFEVYADPNGIIEIWQASLNEGNQYKILPAGLGARDTLRFEVAYWLYGNDIDATTNPFEAGQGFAVKLKKEKFIGKESLEKIQQEGVGRRLVGLSVPTGGIPRHGEEVFLNDRKIGYVTSGNFSPVHKKIFAMAYIDINHSKPNTKLSMLLRNKLVDVYVVDLPFVEPRAGKKKI